jgi:hypothetical protein
MGILDTVLNHLSGGAWDQSHQAASTALDTQKQDLQDRQARAQTFDMDALDKYMSMGATMVGPGDVVHRKMYDPGNPDLGAPPTEGWLLDKADPSRVRTIGVGPHQVKIELPSEEDQRKRALWQQVTDQWNPAARQVREGQNQQAADAAAAKTRGALAGTTAGKKADLENRGVPLSDELADAVGYQHGTMVTPEERDALTEKYNPVRAAQTRTTGAADRTQALIDARKSGVKSTHVTVGPNGQQSLLTVYNSGETEEAPLSATAAPKPGTRSATPGQTAVQNRWQQKLQEVAAKQHEDLAQKEQDQWDIHGALGDALSTPDGETFVDPAQKNGRELTMNLAQRKVLESRYKTAEQKALQLQQQSKKIRQKYGWGEFAPASAPSQVLAGASPSPASSATSGPAATPTNASKIATRAQVQAYAKRYGMTDQQAMNAVTAEGYKVQ